MQGQSQTSLFDDLSNLVPLLRRHARALSGSQQTGDMLAAKVLERVVDVPDALKQSGDRRVALYTLFHEIWRASGRARSSAETGIAAKAQEHLDRLTQNSREALLLFTVEGFSRRDVATILGIPLGAVQPLLDSAYAEMAEAVAGRVLIIEDEPIISLDLEAIVADMGHQVVGTARTEAEAIALAQTASFDLILSDIQLADNTSGLDAVTHILNDNRDPTVIFITAYPERVLTGRSPEPAFLIAKPFTESQVRSAVSQAMFFATTETLLGD